MIVYSRIPLPPATRAEALAKDPEIAWTHSTVPHVPNADAQARADYRYEGRS